MPIVRIDGSDKQIEVGKGANLRRSLLLSGLTPYRGLEQPFNCHGLGLCKTCWVELVEGEENVSAPSKMERLPLIKPLAAGRRLSCQLRIYGDCVVRLHSSNSAE